MSLLALVFGQAESSNNPNIGMQSTGTIGGQYQQSYGFQQQYGGNTSGITNTDPNYQEATLYSFANSATQSNPGMSIGDLYAQYYTGTPGASFANLPAGVQSNFLNAASNYGVDSQAPASSYYNAGTANPLTFTTADASASDGWNSNSVDPSMGAIDPQAAPGTGYQIDPAQAATDPGAVAEAQVPGLIADEPATIGLSSGLAAAAGGWVSGIEQTGVNIANSVEKAVGTAWDNTIGALLANVQNMFIRGMLIVIGIVILFIALWRLVAPDVNARDIAQAMAVAG